MSNTLISTVAAINIFLSPVMPNAITMEQNTEAVSEIKTTHREIKEGESLSSIAIDVYGDEKFWTTIWNDNPWIKNPYIVEVGWKLKIRNEKPSRPENLSEELSEKFKSLNLVALAATDPIKTQLPTQTVFQLTSGPLSETQLQFLGNCESGMTATKNSGNGYYGAFQFSIGTWNRMNTGYARADMAPLEVQKDAAQRLVAQSDIFGQFPACSRKMRSQGLI